MRGIARAELRGVEANPGSAHAPPALSASQRRGIRDIRGEEKGARRGAMSGKPGTHTRTGVCYNARRVVCAAVHRGVREPRATRLN